MSLGLLKMASLQSRTLGASPRGGVWRMCLLRFLGHAQCLPVSLPQVPGLLPAKNATPLSCNHC